VSLAVQKTNPKWVVIADLGSDLGPARALRRLADEYRISYLEIARPQHWSKALAFNTALRSMPSASHIVQLDADMILHPDLLELTRQALARCQAVSCTMSYAREGSVPDGYDGNLASYCRLLCASRRGVPWGRGGYMVLPRDWLLVHHGIDESYVDWGYEDADLWWRAKKDLRTYTETTGSMVIHQPHPRQRGASTVSGNQNWLTFSRRLAGERFEVNRNSFGDASVTDAVIRQGIRGDEMAVTDESTELHSSARRDTLRWMFSGPLQETIRDGRLTGDTAAVLTESTTPNTVGTGPFRVSVVLLMRDQPKNYAEAVLSSALRQTHTPAQVILADCTVQEGAEGHRFLCSEFERVRYIRCDAPAGSNAQPILDHIIRQSSVESTHVLVADGDLILHPRALELLRRTQSRGRRFVHGYTQYIPRMAVELDLIESMPWRTWWSVAYAADFRTDSWYLAPRRWVLKAIGSSHGAVSGEKLCAVAHLSSDIDALCLAPNWVLAVRCPQFGDPDSEPDREGPRLA
jgi:hypothetical protein